MVIIVNGYYEISGKYFNHSAIWEDVENADITVGKLLDQIGSYGESVKLKFFEDANEVFEEPVKLSILNIKFLFQKFDGVEDLILTFNNAAYILSIDKIINISIIKNTQVVQFLDSEGTSISEIFAVPKMFYDSWKGGKRRTDFDLFNNSAESYREFIIKNIGNIRDFKFKYIDPFEIDQTLWFETTDFVSSDQLSLQYIFEDQDAVEDSKSIPSDNSTNILSIDGMKVAIDDIIWFMGEYYHCFDNKRLMDIIYDEVKNIESGSFEAFRTLYCDLRYISIYFIHVSKTDKSLILQFINEYFNDAVKVLSEHGYDIGEDSVNGFISEKLKSYKDRIKLE